MSTQSPQSDQTGQRAEGAGETPKDTTPSLSPKGEITKVLEAGKGRISRAAREAWEKSFGKSWMAKLNPLAWPQNASLFLTSFLKAMTEVEEKKEKVKDETETAVAQAIANTDSGDVADNLTEELDKEAHFEPEEKEAVATLMEDTLEAAKATEKPGKVVSVLDRVREDAEKGKGNPDKLSEADVQYVFATGLFTLVRLRERFNTEEKLEEFLGKVWKAGAKSVKVRELSAYIGNHFKQLVDLREDQVPSLLGINVLKFAPFKAASALGFGGSAEDRLANGLDIVLPELFPNSTTGDNLSGMRAFFVRFIQGKRYPTPAEIAELTFMIDENDMRELARRMSGAKTVSLASVAETEKRKAEAKKKKEAGKKTASAKKDAKPAAGKTADHSEEEPDLKTA